MTNGIENVMLLAESTDTNWEVIISALGLVAVSLYREYLAHGREKDKIERDEKAEKALRDVAENVQTIEVATNSMKDALVESTRVSSEAVGVLRGRAEVKAETAAETAAVVKADRETDESRSSNE